MTLKTKNIILNTSTIIAAVSFLTLLLLNYLFNSLHDYKFYIQFVFSIFIISSLVFIHVFYKKSLPSEILFLTIFLLSFSIETLCALQLIPNNYSIFYLTVFGRISIFFKYLGLFSILGASLFSYTIKKQKIGSWVLISIMISLIISSIIHFNTSLENSYNIPRIIFFNEELVLSGSIVLLLFSTFLKSSFDSKNSNYIYLAFASVALSLSFIFMINITALAGFISSVILFISGTTLYMRSMHNITLWS